MAWCVLPFLWQQAPTTLLLRNTVPHGEIAFMMTIELGLRWGWPFLESCYFGNSPRLGTVDGVWELGWERWLRKHELLPVVVAVDFPSPNCWEFREL